MSTIQVRQAAQQLFPFGQQEPFIITNKGPYTVFLDSDSSISETQSYPLLPTGSIPWDGTRPLWVCGSTAMGSDGSSTLIITRNSNTAIFNTGIQDALLNRTQVLDASSAILLEATAWSTIILRLTGVNIADNVAPDPASANVIFGEVQWFDSSLTMVASDTFSCPAASKMNSPWASPVGPQQLTIAFPVKARYFKLVSITNGTGVPISNATLDTLGTTLVYKPFMRWTPNNGISVHSSPGAIASSAAENGSDGFAFNIGASGWPTLYFSSNGKILRGSIRCGETVITAGSMAFRSALNGSIIHAPNVAIPIGGVGVSVATFEIKVPIYTPTQIFFTVPQKAGPVNVVDATMKLWWADD